jgi:hypothetical protein
VEQGSQYLYKAQSREIGLVVLSLPERCMRAELGQTPAVPLDLRTSFILTNVTQACTTGQTRLSCREAPLHPYDVKDSAAYPTEFPRQ